MANKLIAFPWNIRNLKENTCRLVMCVPEVVEGYPGRILPKNEAAAQVLKRRTLTNLYNERPAWLDNVHRALDTAVAEAYGWHPDMPDDEMLTKLLALNVERGKEHPRRWDDGHARQPRRGRPSSGHRRDDP